MPPKKQIIVVKSLRDLSPKKQFLVSRQFQDDDLSQGPGALETSHLGNHSPSKPIKLKTGEVVPRSILGDPAVYDSIEKRLFSESAMTQGGSNSSTNQETRDRNTSSRKSIRSGKTTPSADVEASESFADESKVESPSKYINTLIEQKENAKKLQTNNYDQEAKLIAFLPLHERLIFGKEKKVLVKWQERQRDWERIYAELSSKIQAPGGHSLLMETTEEFRAKMEEYDLLQAAVPFQDKFGAHSWQMTLRGGSNRVVSVGHVFTGLECDVDKPLPKPPMVRKPISNKKYKRGSTYLEETKALVHRRKKLKKYIKDIRPQNLSFEDAAELVVKGQDLFDWAIDSSKEFYTNLNNFDEFGVQNAANVESDVIAENEHHKMRSSLECLTSEVLYSTSVGKSTVQKISLTNTGDVAIRYIWKPLRSNDLSENPNLNSQEKESEVGKLITSRINKFGEESRDRQIFRKRNNFHCFQQKGVILPGETVHTLFTFYSEVGGVFRESWNLTCSPRVRFTITSQPNAEVKESGLVPFNFRCQCNHVDETELFRNSMKQLMNESTFECMLKDEFSKCFRRIRNSIRPNEVDKRKIVLFSEINRVVLNSIVGRLANSFPIFVNTDRIQLVEKLCFEVAEFVVEVKAALYFTKLAAASTNMKLVRELYTSLCGPDNKLDWLQVKNWFKDIESNISTRFGADFDIASHQADLSRLGQAHCVPERIESIATRLLPEGSLDVFDEVDISVFHPPWDYSVEGILSRLSAALNSCDDIQQLEDDLILRIKAFDKQTRKENRAEALRLKRLGIFIEKAKSNPDPFNPDDFDDDEDEEEEEEEEQEEEKDEDAEIPKHVLNIRSQNFISKCFDILAVTISTPFDKQSIEPEISKALCDSLDKFDDLRAAALESCGLSTSAAPFAGKLPPIASPFTSDEGAALWEAIINPPKVVEEVVDPKAKGKAPPAKGKVDPKAAAAAGPTPEQINQYYKSIHDSFKNEIINSILQVTAIPNSDIKDADFTSTAQIRPADIRQQDSKDALGKIIFSNFPGYLFTDGPTHSAFNFIKSEQIKYLTEVKDISESGAHSLVLLYETPANSSSPLPWAQSVEHIGNTLNAMNQATVKAKELVYTKKMKKWNRANDKAAIRMAKWKNLNFQREPSPEDISSLMLKIDPVDDVILDVIYTVKAVNSIAEMKFLLGKMAAEDSRTEFDRKSVSLTYERRYVTIYVVENIKLDGVVPPEESMKEEIEEFDDAPILIGADDYKDFRKVQFELKRPHKVEVKVTSGGQSGKVQVYSDSAASLVDLFEVASNSKFEARWVDLSDEALFDYHCNSSFQKISLADSKPSSIAGVRLLGKNARDSILYSSIVHLIALNNDKNSHSTDLLGRFFPAHDFSASAPRSFVVIGGAIRADKFRVIDELLNTASSIAITGEVSIPFLSFASSITFSKYWRTCLEYRSLVQSIIAKARALGVSLLLPNDIMTGDEPIVALSDRKYKVFNCFASSNPIETRDDGFDYEGESKSVNLEDLAGKTLDKYIYDIGPSFVKTIQEQVALASVAVVWGLTGVSECSTYQAGTKALVESIIKVPGSKSSATSKPQQSVIIGNDTVEWFTRFSDPDCEFNGDLVSNGFVSYSNRNSSVFVGVLGGVSSPLIQLGLLRREPVSQELDVSRFVPEVVVEEDDDE